jgi:hypothetical protein
MAEKRKASEAYLEKLKDPRWQKKRLRVLERDDWACRRCADTTQTLHVHHRVYVAGADPWDYSDAHLVTLCETCHAMESARRPEAEAELLDALRQKFFWDDIKALAGGFSSVTGAFPPVVVAEALTWMLSDPELLAWVVAGWDRAQFGRTQVSEEPRLEMAEALD